MWAGGGMGGDPAAKRRKIEEGGIVPRAFKTALCKFAMQGTCNKGDACTYAHSPAELQAHPGGGKGGGWDGGFGMDPTMMMMMGGGMGKGCGGWGGGKTGGKGGGTQRAFKTQICKYFLQGTCQKGTACSFAHGEHELNTAAPPQMGAEAAAMAEFNALVAGGAGGKAGGKGFKTRMCNYFMMGTCTKGEACTFAHGEHEMQPGGNPNAGMPMMSASADGSTSSGFKTRMCKFFMMGQCQKGEACSYAHGEHEIQPGKGGMMGGMKGKGKGDMMGGFGMMGGMGKGMGMMGKGMGMMALGMGGGWGKGGGKSDGPRPFKTKMCNFHLEGRCTKGDACTFAHDPSEIQAGGGGLVMPGMA